MSIPYLLVFGMFAVFYAPLMYIQWRPSTLSRVAIQRWLAFVVGSRSERVIWSTFSHQMGMCAFVIVYMVLAVFWHYHSFITAGLAYLLLTLVLLSFHRAP